MANGTGTTRLVDGQLDWSGGIDSGRVPTMVSPGFDTGLQRNQLAWLTNGTVRGGGVNQRTGWKPLVRNVPWTGIFQCGYMYEPAFADPYMILMIGGRIYQVRLDTDNSVVDLSAVFGETMPADQPLGFMCQAEQFLVIQSGDLITKPLFWDGNILRRSNGFISVAAAVTAPFNEIPPAGPMDYYMGRLWYAFGRQYCAGDIVGSKVSGTVAYNYRDSVLRTTENPLSLAGDAFIVPTNAGNIRALKHSANLDSALGEGQLYPFTRKNIYATSVPVTRALWSTLTEPLQRVAQRDFGSVGDRCVVPVNGDLFYQAMDGIRSLAIAVRNFGSWGNIPISKPEQRVLRFNDRALMRFASGINFDNRMWQTVVPFQTAKGVAHQGIIPLDFDLLGSMADRLPPSWEGMLEGLHVLQLFEADYGGLQRAFATVVSQVTGSIDIWEFTTQDRWDSQINNDGSRVSWYLETPAYTWGDPFMLKQLDGLELWFDKMLGTVNFMVEYKVDQSPCWIPWHSWKQCVAKDCREDVEAVSCPAYPIQPYCEGFKATVSLPSPPVKCEANNARPSTWGYQFQIRITIKGWTRLRGLRVYANPKAKAPFQNMVCSASNFFVTESTPSLVPPAPVPPEPDPGPSPGPEPEPEPDPDVPPDEDFISWTPDTATAGWEDGAANFFTGDLATFLAGVDLNDMVYFECLSQGITAITGLHLMVTCTFMDLSGNSLTHIPTLPATGALTRFDAQSNQIATINNFPSTLTIIGLGGNQLTSLPPIPAGVAVLFIGTNLFPAATVNSICGELVTNGLNNGTLDMTGLDASLALANIGILQGRGWTVLT
jgi:hypothetical protein